MAGTAYNTVGGGGDETIQSTTFSSTETIRGLGSVNTLGSVTVASAANVTFKAGSGITLGDGFTIESGATFKAEIDSFYNSLQNSWQATLFSYDREGRVKNKYVFTSGITSGDATIFTYAYDRLGNVTHVKVYRSGQEIHHWNNFDERGLLKGVSVAQNSAQPTLVDFDFGYTPTGLVQAKKINETSSGVFNTTMSFQYHARDWLTDINDVNSTAKPFAAEYSYRLDGNIQTATFYNQSSSIEQKYKYEFGYDGRKQLTNADYFYDNNSVWVVTNHFDVAGLTYDLNGNITRLKRKKETGGTIDNLTYSYGTNNQLNSVADAVATTSEDWDAEDLDFTYDSNGNVKTVKEDGSYKFKSIQYDSRNLPVFIETDSVEIIYLYSAECQRIYKKVDNNLGEHYIMDGSLNVGVFDENGSLQHWNMLADGIAGRVDSSGEKRYYLKDHLGSTRAVIDDSGSVVESHDYYPFGLQMPGRSFLAGSVRTKELFTGKELDDETGWHNLGARPYIPAIGRFPTVDPLANLAPDKTPYHYTSNNPINRIDILGLFDDPIKNPQYRGWYAGGKWKPGQSKFGKVRGQRYHQGVDLYAKVGTEAVAVEDGTVFQTSADSKISGFGNYVVIKFTDKDGKTRYAVYAHLKGVDVKKGDKVKEGDEVGTTGTTGVPKSQPKEGAHLHFEILKKWWPGTKKKGNENRENPTVYFDIDDAKKEDQKKETKKEEEEKKK